jgi:cytochrome P450 family 4
MSGKKWKIRRRMITPTFHFKILDQFLGIFNTCGNILIDKLSGEVGKDSVDIYPFINLYSLDVICGQ